MKKQRGVVTLTVSLILLFLITLNAFISSKGSLMEQQSANNAYYAEQAFQNAEQGLAKVMADIMTYLEVNPSTTTLANIPQGTTNQTLANVYATSISGSVLTSTGAIEGLGTRKVSQFLELVAGGPAALNALGNINMGGNASASSVKSGGTISIEGSGSVAGAQTSNSNEFKVALRDHNGDIMLDSSGNTLFRNMTTEEFFMYYFAGLCPTAYAANDAMACQAEAKEAIRADAKGYVCESTCNSKTADDAISAAYTAGKRRFWLEGGIDHKLDMGTDADPVLILVMNVIDNSKAAQINANSTITGLLYVDVNYTTTNCSCTGTATVASVATVDDLTKPLTFDAWGYSAGNSVCKGTGKPKQCKQTLTDSYGNTNVVTINDGDMLIDPSTVTHPVLTYQQKSTFIYGALGNISLNTGQPALCTVSACTETENKCTPLPTSSTAIGSTEQCSYQSKAVTSYVGSADPVQIEILGTWDGSGTGNAVLKGAAITSGNYSGQGTIEFIQNSAAVTKAVLGGLGGFGMTGAPTLKVTGWTDMKQ